MPAAVALLLLWLLVPGAADAATVSLGAQGSNRGPPPPPVAVFSAEAGETNDVVATTDGDTVTFTDRSVTVTAERGCDQLDAHRVRCRRVDGAFIWVRDMDDRVRAGRAATYGGPGADTIEGGGGLNGEAGDDVLRGGPKADGLAPGPGADRVYGGGGNDNILEESHVFGDELPPPPEFDLLDGGPGLDTVDYGARPAPGTIDLRRGLGHMPDSDTLVSIEGGISRRNGDALLGHDGPNRLEAWGRSFQSGRAGADTLDAHAPYGIDTLDAGAGDDRIGLNNDSQLGDLFARDRLRCGPGTDTVEDPGANALLAADCERVSFLGTPQIRLPTGRASAREPIATISGYCELEPCKGATARLRLATSARSDERPRSGATLARGTAGGVSDFERVRLRLLPNARARRLLRRGTCALATLEILGLGTEGEQLILFRFGRRCRPAKPLSP